MNCPFYGVSCIIPRKRHPLAHHAGPLPSEKPYCASFILLPSGGDQCGLVTSSHAPCYMEYKQGKEPDWKTCDRVTDVRGGKAEP